MRIKIFIFKGIGRSNINMVKRFRKQEGKQLVYESYDELLELWNVEKKEIDLETTYGKTHIIIAGKRENPSLLLFHGVGDNSAIMWIYNIQELVKHFFIIAVDTIGGPGKSEINENYIKKFEQALWIDEILNTLDINKTNIAGVSNGAYLTQYYAIKRPSRINKVVCMAGTISAKGSQNPLFRMMKVFLPEALFPTEKNTKRLIKKLCGPNYEAFINNDRLMKHWAYLLKYFNNRAMMYHKIIRFNDEEIATIRDRSLFLIGDYDRLVYHPDSVKALTDNNLNYKIVKNAGHGINHEQHELINKEIIHFLLDLDNCI
jgi:pimeloyl-ACP methyl ester carboxylesterase